MQDEEFDSRLLSKESSIDGGGPSFRVYFGVASGTVPFMWESQPGTPKHVSISSTSLPPLAPPPSCSSSSSSNTSRSTYEISACKKLSSTFCRLVHSIIPKISANRGGSRKVRAHSPASAFRSLLTSMSTSSSSSSASSSSDSTGWRRRYSSQRPSLSSKLGEDDQEKSGDRSPASTLCFAIDRRSRS